MKRFFALLVTTVLIVSMLGVMTAFAGTSISGYSSVNKGKTYTYTIKVSASGIDMFGNVKCSGVFTGATVQFGDKGSGAKNESLYDKVTIKVTVASDAKPGDTGKIYLSEAGYTYYDSSGAVQEKSLSGSKTVTVVIASSSGSTTKSVKATPAPTVWDIAATNVQAMQAGGAVNVDVKDDPNIPASLLSSVKEKQGSLTANFGGYTCAIDGKSLGNIPEGLKSINLSMKTDKDEALTAAAGGKDAYQLHFAHSGQLPGRFSYTFKAESSKPGDVLYLYYYYNQPGICEGVQSAVVDADGNVTFDIFHCSSYFVSASVIDGATGVDFASEDKARQALTEAEGKQAELQTRLDEAQSAAEELQTQVDALKSQDAPEKNPLTAAVSGPVESLFGVPYGSLIAAIAGAALVSMFLTMLFGRVGIFKKRTADRTDIE